MGVFLTSPAIEPELQEVEVIAESFSAGEIEIDDEIQLAEAYSASEAQTIVEQQDTMVEPESKRARHERSSEDVDDGKICTICFESWSNSGRHQLCSLKCGHLFGLSCIQRWLDGCHNRCPQCNARAKKSHIRKLYATSLVAVDSSEKDNALKQLQDERSARLQAENNQAQVLLDCQIAKSEVESLKRTLSDIERLSQTSPALSQRSRSYLPGTDEPSSYSYQLQSSCVVSETGGVRLLGCSPGQSMFAASKKLASQSGYGILKISIMDTSHREYVEIHSKLLKDLHFNPCGDRLLLTCSLDKTLKITNLHTNTIVQSYTTPYPVWSCSWSKDDSNSIFCGLQNGQVFGFDIRRTSGPVTELDALRNPCPVISCASLSGSNVMFATYGDVGLWYEESSMWQFHSLFKPSGPITSMDFHPPSLYTMLSLRLPKENNRSQHLLRQLETSEDDNIHVGTPVMKYGHGSTWLQLEGSVHSTLMTRSRVFAVAESEGERLLAAAGDEPTNTVFVWDVHSGRVKQQLPPCRSPVLDIQPYTIDNSDFLATLTDHQLSVYRWR
ncbi:E3 ubiquitin-protein ligase RFWD3-like isoform X2 [Corticium candelabrum]|uniref:E3 ubiquitin-protein ligase RFWD3-like isoform X2 n=1 Tax=Corticium candelabrum TaxID=121492 RepID=UPI002E25811D|nr:E3 ubiquitin-protein ligase RFWD3-like isoform X2 [Corticium candelabrum]